MISIIKLHSNNYWLKYKQLIIYTFRYINKQREAYWLKEHIVYNKIILLIDKIKKYEIMDNILILIIIINYVLLY